MNVTWQAVPKIDVYMYTFISIYICIIGEAVGVYMSIIYIYVYIIVGVALEILQ